LIHQPQLLVLDEPTTGVDAVSRSEFWDMLKNLRQYNITIVVSTPYMDEAMRCDRVALIQDGQILLTGLPGDIRDGFSRKLFSVTAREKYPLIMALKSYPGTESVYPFGDSVHLTLREGESVETVSAHLERKGITGVSILETRAGIEDRFLELMNREQ
jgi:ABC-type multidrug transport system ATPase subunit